MSCCCTRPVANSDISSEDIPITSEKKTSSRFYVGAVLTLSDCNLPVGTEIEISRPCGYSKWELFAKDKAFSMTSFAPDEFTEDETKLKNMLREWAEKNGIEFG